MDTQHLPLSVWQQMIRQSFLSLYDVSEEDSNHSQHLLQGYDFVFEFSGATVYLIVNDVVMQANQQEIDSTQVREWRKEVVNQLIKRHAQLYLKNDEALADANASASNKAIYFIGLTSLAIKHENDNPESQPIQSITSMAVSSLPKTVCWTWTMRRVSYKYLVIKTLSTFSISW